MKRNILIILAVAALMMVVFVGRASGQNPYGETNRYYMSTNVLNLAMLNANIALETRFNKRFALKTSLVGGVPWIAQDGGYNRHWVMTMTGLLVEPRWYTGHRRSFHIGPSTWVLLFNDYDRKEKAVSETIPLWGVNCVAGFYWRRTERFGIDFTIGLGTAVLVYMPIAPFGELGVSLSWQLGRKTRPVR